MKVITNKLGRAAKQESVVAQQAIQLINVYSCNNVGDAAIYASLIDMAEGIKTCWPENQQDGLANNAKVGHVAMSYNPYRSIDMQLSVGGDIFNNARPKLITRRFLENITQLRSQPQATALFGQSVPRSCQGLSFQLLSSSLKKIANVTVRDQESYDRLRQAGVDANLSYDAVFSQQVQRRWVESVAYHLRGVINFSETAIISLRPFDNLYQYDSQRCLEKIVGLCQELKKQGYVPTILHHAHVDGKDADAVMVAEIQKHCVVKVIDPLNIDQSSSGLSRMITPWQFTMAAISMAALVVGIRYHTSVFRLAADKMPFNIYYSNKGQDLCDRLGVPGVSIQNFCPQQHIGQILDTAYQTFDSQTIRQQVRADFKRASKDALSRNQKVEKGVNKQQMTSIGQDQVGVIHEA